MTVKSFNEFTFIVFRLIFFTTRTNSIYCRPQSVLVYTSYDVHHENMLTILACVSFYMGFKSLKEF